MKRIIYNDLLRWKDNPDRKPLILYGARQVGKTWILKEFGRQEYENMAYINCDNNPVLKDLFSDYDIQRIIRALSALLNIRIDEKTLIVFDEVQEFPKTLTALKYFFENAPHYSIAVAGSLLRLKVHQGSGFPVGKVDELMLYPMTFHEFLKAMGEDILLDVISQKDWNVMDSLRDKCIELLRQYYFTGGMPEVVKTYILTHDLIKTRLVQNKILNDYRMDFGKHIPSSMISKVNLVWDAIPSQLAKDNKKFIYNAIKPGGRARDFEDAIQWLQDAGLIHKINRIKKLTPPLKFYEEFGTFKLFMLDLGLLGAMTETSASQILIGSKIFEEYKGAFTEQYVAQQLIASNRKLYYYTNESSTLEIDFVLQNDGIHPIEVKAEENLRAKSLKTVLNHHPELHGYRFSMANYREEDQFTNIPLFAI